MCDINLTFYSIILFLLRNYLDLMSSYIHGKMYITGVVRVNTFLFTQYANQQKLSIEGTLTGAIQEVGGVYSIKLLCIMSCDCCRGLLTLRDLMSFCVTMEWKKKTGI